MQLGYSSLCSTVKLTSDHYLKLPFHETWRKSEPVSSRIEPQTTDTVKIQHITSSTATYYTLQLYHRQFSIFFRTRAMGFEKVIITAGTAGQRAARGAQVTVHCTGISINVSIVKHEL
jgi:hypothetical protein